MKNDQDCLVKRFDMSMFSRSIFMIVVSILALVVTGCFSSSKEGKPSSQAEVKQPSVVQPEPETVPPEPLGPDNKELQ